MAGFVRSLIRCVRYGSEQSYVGPLSLGAVMFAVEWRRIGDIFWHTWGHYESHDIAIIIARRFDRHGFEKNIRPVE